MFIMSYLHCLWTALPGSFQEAMHTHMCCAVGDRALVKAAALEAAAIRRAAGIRLAVSPVKSDPSSPKELRNFAPAAIDARKGVTRARKPSTDIPVPRPAAAKGRTRKEVEVDAAAAEETADTKQEVATVKMAEKWKTVEESDSPATAASNGSKVKSEKVAHLLSLLHIRRRMS